MWYPTNLLPLISYYSRLIDQNIDVSSVREFLACTLSELQKEWAWHTIPTSKVAFVYLHVSFWDNHYLCDRWNWGSFYTAVTPAYGSAGETDIFSVCTETKEPIYRDDKRLSIILNTSFHWGLLLRISSAGTTQLQIHWSAPQVNLLQFWNLILKFRKCMEVAG